MTTTVEHITRMIGGKEYQLRITRQRGLQEVVLNGKPTLVESVTYTEWPGKMGTTESYTVARPQKSDEEECAFLASVRETAVNGLIAQGIW